MAQTAGQPRVQRRYPRVPMRTQVQYHSTHLSVAKECRDIGLGGMFLATQTLDAVGTPAVIRFQLPETGQEFVCHGVVRWTTLDEEIVNGRFPTLSGMGFEFDVESAEIRDELVRVFGEQILPHESGPAEIHFLPPTVVGSS